MFSELLHREYDKCFRLFSDDEMDTVEISGWYCIAQWACYLIGSRPLTRNELWNCLGSQSFQNILMNCSLDRYPIIDCFERVYDLCGISLKNNMMGLRAKFFYRDYLPCAVADTSLFDDTSLPSYYNGPVSCTLIHLAMLWAGDHLGKREIFMLLATEIGRLYRTTLNNLGVSQEEFERYWDAVHYLNAYNPMISRPKVDAAIRSYKKMKVPMAMLLEQYASARNFTPEQLRKEINPWEYVQKSTNAVLQETGMSIDEKLFNSAAYQISREDPVDVVHSIFYKGRDDSRIESALVHSEMLRIIKAARKSLIVNPSPAFLVEYDRIWKNQWKKTKDKQVYEVVFAVKDHVLAFLFSQQFPEYRFILFDQMERLEPDFNNVVILARDHDYASLLCAMRLCQNGAFFTALIPQTAITLTGNRFAADLRDSGISVNWIMDIPSILCQSKPKKKLLLSGRHLPGHKTTMNLLFATTDRNGDYLVLDKKHYSVPTDWISKGMTLAQMRSTVIKANEKHHIPAARPFGIYNFSVEIKISYHLIKNKYDELEKARAYYRNIHRPEIETSRSKGKRPNDKKTERGLRGKSEAEIMPKLEYVAFYEEFCDDIVADIMDYYKADLSSLTVKTMWFCCRKELLNRISYDDELAKRLFCGGNQVLSDLVSGDATADSLISAMAALCGENNAGRKGMASALFDLPGGC